MASHLDPATRQKIINHEFVDFAKLLPPRDRKFNANEDEQLMRLINKGGQAFYALVENGSAISSYGKWEQAFRVFLDVYNSKFPTRATELIQYNHIIFMASVTYAWENMYTYDQEFRRHMSQNPSRNWGIILQQAYMLYLKDRQKFHGSSMSRNVESGVARNKKLCYSFNKGKCTYGAKCKFDHKCGFCSKFGHGVFNCRKGGGGKHTSSPTKQDKALDLDNLIKRK